MLARLTRARFGDFTLYLIGNNINAETLLDRFMRTRSTHAKGRGGLKLLTIDTDIFACRKYLHGGLVRALTQDLFFTANRAFRELGVMLYLKEKGFPVVEPVGILIGEDFPFKKPHIITRFEEHIHDLLEFMKISGYKQRLRAVRDLADSFRDLQDLGVYHPDLHLRNVLVREDGALVFLDFDKARRQTVSEKDVERMMWRLHRFVQKWEHRGYLTVTPLERQFFLRRYSRRSAYNLEDRMAKKAKTKSALARVGWFIEALLYKKT